MRRPSRRPSTWATPTVLGALVLGLTGFTPPQQPDPYPPYDQRATALLARNVLTPADDEGPAPEDPADAAEELGRDVVRTRTAKIRPSALAPLCGPAKPGFEARFPLFEDVVVEAVEEARTAHGDHVVWHGTVKGTAPSGDQDVVVTLKGGCDASGGDETLSAHFVLGGEHFAIEPAGPGTVRVHQITPLTSENDASPAAPRHRAGNVTYRTEGPAERSAPGCDSTIPVVDILAAYSPLALKEAGGASQIRAQIARGVSLTNDAFADSGARLRARLVGIVPISLPAAYDTVSPKTITALATPGDGIADTLPTLRTRYGADQVSTVVGGLAAGGIGYVPAPPGPSYADWAYSVVAEQAIWHFSFGHELGHNLGASHDRTTEPQQPTRPLGANGYFPKSGEWSTVMAYESGCETATKGPCNRINRFSNAAQTYRGEPLGVALNKPLPSNTAAVFNTTGRAVAAYNAPKTPAALCPVTTSVSPAGGGTVTPAQEGPYARGMTTVFTAAPAKGYVFSGWTLDGKAAGSAPHLNVAMTSGHTLKATFRKGTTPTRKVATRTTGKGTVKKAAKSRASTELEGTDHHFTAVPEPGHSFSHWVLDGSYAGNHDDIVLRVGQHDSELTAVFEKRQYNLALSSRGRGTISASRPAPYGASDTVTVTAVPAPGYAFQDWLLDGKPYGGRERATKARTAVEMRGHHRLTAVFRRL
ncbi:hypothetical protein IAG44_20210 [Streptomyces roseirectus]|uniref:Bacterial repeat domain-containing protein n=1 Tax=Streptomyces roseirectus TaxID=2768066 RepID=A0A7H0IFF6_9ACTN|nr:M12 family metallo-peptidase [Streptomyces roseirectus]QNP71522.1 hypothetical protein IAG44_20210 [Streptomyces roseirectus]